jgi:hypothetical protein
MEDPVDKFFHRSHSFEKHSFVGCLNIVGEF